MALSDQEMTDNESNVARIAYERMRSAWQIVAHARTALRQAMPRRDGTRGCGDLPVRKDDKGPGK
jgi:hypothetical protein